MYIVNFTLMSFEALLLLRTNDEHKKKIFISLVAIQWILISGLRSVYVGADTYAYKQMFEQGISKSWSAIWNEFVGVYTNTISGKDVGYTIFEKLFSYISTDYRVYLFAIAIFFMVPLARGIYRYSKDPYISFIVYSLLFYNFFSITGIRQTIATAIVFYFGYELIKKRKFISFVLLILLVATIHKSILIFIVYYFIANRKLSNIYFSLFGIAIVLVWIFKVPFFNFLAISSGYNELYAVQYTGTYMFTFLYGCISIFAFMYMRRVIQMNANARHYYNALILSWLFIPLTYVEPNTMRIVQYFSLFILYLLPEVLSECDGNTRQIFRIGSVAVGFLYLFFKSDSYAFFWQ
jgi:hypothetical protein